MARQTQAQKDVAEAKAREKAKAVKFVELAEKRATKAINAIRSLAKLSSANYVYNEEQVKTLAEALRKEVVDMNDAFTKTTSKEKRGFTF